MNALLPPLLPVAKYLTASAALYLLYRLVFRKYASYKESRLFLLSITLLAIPLSQFRIEVTHPAPVYVQVERRTPPAATPAIASNPIAALSEIPAADNNTSAQTIPATPKPVPFLQQASTYTGRHPGHLLLAVYLLVSLILMSNLLIQYLRIRRLKRSGQREEHTDYTLIVHTGIATPFSAGKTVFLPRNLSQNQQEVVLNHECWHIRHRHYIDVLVQEILTSLFWFNPLQWILRKELRSIHEFETDRSVLGEGTDLYRYQTIILEEVMGNHFRLANGFNQSFTKKRFIQMKNTQLNRLATSHKIVLACSLTLVFAALSLTPGRSQVVEVEKSTQLVNGVPVTTTRSSSVKIDTTSLLNIDTALLKQPGYLQTTYLKSLDSMQRMVNAVLPIARKLAASPNPASDTRNMNALLNSMSINANGQSIRYEDLSKEFISSLTRQDFIQLKSVFENMNDSIRLFRTHKITSLRDPNALRILTLAQDMMSSDFVSKLFPELFSIMGKQLNGMMEGMSNSLVNSSNNSGNTTSNQTGKSNRVSNGRIGSGRIDDASDMGKTMGTMLGTMTQQLGKMVEGMTKATQITDTTTDKKTP